MRYCPICERRYKGDTRECPFDGSVTLQLQERGGALVGYELDGRWEIGDRLREGGMGAIHIGRQLSVKRSVAIKLMRSDIMAEPRLMARFFREARALSALQHPNIVTLFDFGQDEHTGLLYMVMELLRGQPLSDILDEGYVFPLSTVFYIAEQLSSALIEVHEQGVIHRDLKPENIFLEHVASGFHVKLIDFGVAMLDEPQLQRLTATGQLQGTPHYMAPEQINGEQASPQSDLYSLGVILYEILSGRPPFIGDTLMAVLYKHLSDRPDPLRDVWALADPPHEGLLQLVDELLSKDPAGRPRDAVEVWERLGLMTPELDEAPPLRRATPGAIRAPAPSAADAEAVEAVEAAEGGAAGGGAPKPPEAPPPLAEEPAPDGEGAQLNTLERMLWPGAPGSNRAVVHVAVAAALALIGLAVLLAITSGSTVGEGDGAEGAAAHEDAAREAGARAARDVSEAAASVFEEVGAAEAPVVERVERDDADAGVEAAQEGATEEAAAPTTARVVKAGRKRAAPREAPPPRRDAAAQEERKKLDALLEQMRSP